VKHEEEQEEARKIVPQSSEKSGKKNKKKRKRCATAPAGELQSSYCIDLTYSTAGLVGIVSSKLYSVI
jgi:hypothetical protein